MTAWHNSPCYMSMYMYVSALMFIPGKKLRSNIIKGKKSCGTFVFMHSAQQVDIIKLTLDISFTVYMGPFTNTCWGTWCKTKSLQKFLGLPLSDLKNFRVRFWQNYGYKPFKKQYKLNFPREICHFFFQGPCRSVKTFRDSSFCIRSPHKCFWTAPNSGLI